WSDVLHVRINKDGSLGSKNRSDAADAHEFGALLAMVRRHLGQIADGVLDGEIGITPYMLGQRTPCPACAFRDICRFEPRDKYHVLEAMNREEVLLRAVEEHGPLSQRDTESRGERP